MKVIIMQTDICWAHPAQNVKTANKIIDNYPEGDLFILPEMFSTGFCIQPKGIAEPADNLTTLQWMKKKAAERNCAIAGSIAIEEDGKYYNRFHFVHPDGKVECYNKRHLFTYGGEDKLFTAGHERVIVEFRGVRILLQICYDLRFPVWARNRNDYDMIVYVANWPIPRIEAWKALVRARAIENQCYVAAVNRTGNDPYCQYNGASAVINPYGETIAACTEGQPSEAVAEIDMKSLNDFRKKFPVLNDADSFTLN